MWRLTNLLKEIQIEEGIKYKIIETATEIAKGDGYPLLLTIEEASEYTGLGITKIRELSKRSDFPKVLNGSKTLVIKKDLPKWLGRYKSRTL